MKFTPKRTFQHNGKWMVKPTQTFVVVCECGNRYIKTRENQKTCLRCFSK